MLEPRIRRKRRRHEPFGTALAQTVEDVEIHEVHDSQDDEHESDFGTDQFHSLTGVIYELGGAERERDVADVDQVKAHDKQVIDGGGEFPVAMKRVD